MVTLARAERRIRYPVRPHVVRLKQQAAHEPPSRDACKALKLLLPSLALRPKELKAGRGRSRVTGSSRLMVYLSKR